jgi:hypothetical protein
MAAEIDRMVLRIELGQRLRAEDLYRLPELCDPHRFTQFAPILQLRFTPGFQRCFGIGASRAGSRKGARAWSSGR